MSINNEIFGKLEYDYIWYKDIEIEFLGKKNKIVLMIDGDEDGEFEEEQYIAYKILMKKWNGLQDILLQEILNYYNVIRHELGYDIEINEEYPLIETIQELVKNIKLAGIVIPYSGAYDGRECGITFDCTWDDENGIGVCLVDEKVVEIGYQDIVM